jgi:hypothetical protein
MAQIRAASRASLESCSASEYWGLWEGKDFEREGAEVMGEVGTGGGAEWRPSRPRQRLGVRLESSLKFRGEGRVPLNRGWDGCLAFDPK